MTDGTVRLMKPSDVKVVVAVHGEAFRGFFLSFLGPAFLRELYSSILADPSGIGYVYEQAGKVVGFVAGTDQPSGFYRGLLRQRWWRFGLACLVPLLKRPTIALRLLRAFSKPKEAVADANCGMLMSIAVLPDEQGRGIGQVLTEAFLQEGANRGLGRVTLTTDGLENAAVNAFYRGLGFRCARNFVTPEGRVMSEYVIDL
jgi:ribosomal protein S18 acetylase RimI-like enzyme